MSGSPSTSTPIQLAPPYFPPGYGFAESFFNNTLPGVMGQPYPTYPGQLDPGMSPTAANALRQAQGYSQSPYPSIFGAAAGSIGEFMNPNYLDPRGGQNRDYGFNYDFSDPYAGYSPPAWAAPPQYGAPQSYGNDMFAQPMRASSGAPPVVGRQRMAAPPPDGGGMSHITAQTGTPAFGGEGTTAETPAGYYGDPRSANVGGAGFKAGWGTQDVDQWLRMLNLLNQGTGQVDQPKGGIGFSASFSGGGGGGTPTSTGPASTAPGAGIGLRELLLGAGLASSLAGGRGGDGGVNFQGGGGGRPATPNLPGVSASYQPMAGGQGFLPFAPGSNEMALTAGIGGSSVRPGGAMPGGGGGGAPGGGLPMPGNNWTNTQDPLGAIPKGNLPWLGRWTGPNKGKSEEEVIFDMWTRGWPMGQEYQPPPQLVEAARAAGQPFEFGSRTTQWNETPGFYRGVSNSSSPGAPAPAPSPAPAPAPAPTPAPAGGGGVSGQPVGSPRPFGGGGMSRAFGGSSVRPGAAIPGGGPAGLPMPGGGGSPANLQLSPPGGPGGAGSTFSDLPLGPAGGGPGQGPTSVPLPGGNTYLPPPPGGGGDPFSQPTSAMDVYRSAVPVMQRDMQNRISDAMAGAGFTGNRFSSSAMKTAGDIGADTGLQQNQLMTSLLYNQTQSDLDRAQRAIDQGINWTGLQDQLAQNRIRLPFEMGQWEQGRQDMFSGQAFQDWSNNRLGWLPMLLQAAQSQSGSPTGPQFGAQQTAGSPGALDYFSALAPILTAYFSN